MFTPSSYPHKALLVNPLIPFLSACFFFVCATSDIQVFASSCTLNCLRRISRGGPKGTSNLVTMSRCFFETLNTPTGTILDSDSDDYFAGFRGFMRCCVFPAGPDGNVCVRAISREGPFHPVSNLEATRSPSANVSKYKMQCWHVVVTIDVGMPARHCYGTHALIQPMSVQSSCTSEIL